MAIGDRLRITIQAVKKSAAQIHAWSQAVHNAFHTKHPKITRIVGGLLRWFYGAIIHPAFAVLLALLLVGFVISGVVTIIVSLSVFFAWLITILAIAQWQPIRKLNILPRVVVVLVMGVITAGAANRYVKWCLSSYARNQPKPTVEKQAERTDSDQLIYERFKDLLAAEIAKAKVPVKEPVKPIQKPNISPSQLPSIQDPTVQQALQQLSSQMRQPSLHISIDKITLTPNGDVSIPLYKSTLSLSAKVDFTLTNSGNSPATHIAASFVLGNDNGAPGYPPGYGCEDTSPTSEYQYRWAPNVSVFPNQPPLSFERVPVKGAFPAISNGVMVVGCVLYKSGDDELHERELHAIQVVFGVGIRHTPEGFEATDALVKYVAPTLPKSAIR